MADVTHIRVLAWAYILVWKRYKASCALTFAGLHALAPRVIIIRVTGIATIPEPRSTTSAATEFAGILCDAALGTSTTDTQCNRAC